MKQYFTLVKQTFSEWSQDKVTVWCAALSYYTLFSISPLLLIIVSLLGLFFGQQASHGEVYSGIKGLIGPSGAATLNGMIAASKKQSTNIISTIIGFIILLLGASGVFGQLKEGLNAVWGVKTKPKAGIGKMLRDRFLSFSMIAVIGFLLAVSLVLSTAITALGTFLGGFLPASPVLLEAINFVLSFGVLTVLFAIMFKILPDVKIPWNTVWIGAVATSLLFTIGKALIGVYLGRSSVTSTYGAAGSLVIILLWVYYSGQIFFLGAEFTKVFAKYKNVRVVPSEFAIATAGSELATTKPKKVKTENIWEFLVAGFVTGFTRKIAKEEEQPFAKIIRGLDKIANYREYAKK